MVNIELLKAEIDDVGITDVKLAEKLGFTTRTLRNKLEKPETISANEACDFANALRITDKDRLLDIFFAPKVEQYGNLH